MVIILIRRFVKPDKETEFLENYRAQQPLNNPAFIGETLTRLVDSSSLPGGLRSFALGEPSSVTYLNVARWQSWEAFAAQFAEQVSSSIGFDPEIETAPRQRAVLEAIADTSN
jgi:hypothetical protein